MSASNNKKRRGNLFDKIVLRTLLGVLCVIGIGLAVIGRLYWRGALHGSGKLEALLGDWADIFTPVTVVVALVCVGVAAVLVVMELVSLD